jgi:ligand-binding sensor domain-containing protein/serine phosphatase RsbU (regulator of sigma subunit)
MVPASQNVYKVPENLTVIPVNKDSLKTFTPGVDTSSFVLVNSTGDTLPTGVRIPVKGKVVPCKQPLPANALPPRKKDIASIDMQYLDIEQGMSSSVIYSVLEDSQGNLWLGTIGKGVSMYNYETFTHFTEEEGLSSNYISSILEDSYRNIWFGTGGGGACRYDGETFMHFTEKEGLSRNEIECIIEDQHGNIWFGTAGGGACRYYGEYITHFTRQEGLSSNNVRSILEDRHGNLWFGTNEGGITVYDGRTFTHFTVRDGLSSNNILSLLEDSQGNIWIGTNDAGVNMFNGESFTYYTEKEGFCDRLIHYIFEDNECNIWFGTDVTGVFMFNGETFTKYTQEEGLRDDDGRGILEDSHGNIWFGTWGGGVYRYNRGSFTHFTEKEGLPFYLVYTILEDSYGNLWFGTYTGLSMYDGKTHTHFTDQQGLNQWIRCSLEDSQGNLWFGTFGGGVSRYDGNTFTRFTMDAGLFTNNVQTILEDSQGNLWFGSMGTRGVCMYDGEKFTHFTDIEGFGISDVTSILEDSDGNIWFGTYGGGVCKYNGETFIRYTEKEGLSDNYVLSILEDSYGNIWLGTENGGVSIFHGETFTYITEKEGLSDNFIKSIQKDGNNIIWLGTARGLNRLELGPEIVPGKMESLSSRVLVIHTYNDQDGLKDIDFNEGCVLLDSKNRIWWGTRKCLTMLDLNKFKIPDKSPVIQLNRIEINDQFIDYRQLGDSNEMQIHFTGVGRFQNYPLDLELPYDRNHLTFHFSAIDWSAPHKIRYSYIMEGLNNTWSAPTSEAKAEYRNMPFGTYTFVVRAIGAAQKWSEPFEYTFTINPPWWHTWRARAGYAAAAVLLVIGIVRWRTSIYKRRQKVLEKEVEERTAEVTEKNKALQSQKEEVESQRDEIQAQRDEIEAQRDLVTKQKDQIQEQKQAMTDSIQYAGRIQTAILPPDEVLKYLLPKHFILFRPRDIVSGDFYWLAHERGKIVIAVADCTGHGVPGAFMSMLGSALLNDVVNNIRILQAGPILDELRDRIMVSLRQTGGLDEAKDGMDIALCILDKKTMKLQFAGGYNQLYLIRNGELTEVKADKMPIGISSKAGKPFTNHELKLRKDDALYLFSDGYVDQFGGPNGKKFMVARFKQLLLDIQDRIMYDQKEVLEHTLDEWMGLIGQQKKRYDQVDDIIVMGIKI